MFTGMVLLFLLPLAPPCGSVNPIWVYVYPPVVSPWHAICVVCCLFRFRFVLFAPMFPLHLCTCLPLRASPRDRRRPPPHYYLQLLQYTTTIVAHPLEPMAPMED